MKYAVALDIGGTKIEGVLFNEHYKELKKKRVYFKKDKSTAIVDLPKKEILKMIDDLITELSEEYKIKGIGVSIPDIVTPDGKLGSVGKIIGLRNFAIKSYLAKKHHTRCYVKNDADCLILGEWARGAGKNCKNVIGVIYGTGIGSGIIIDGKLYSGSHGSAGEFGYNTINPNGPVFHEGLYGVVESYAAGPYLVRNYKAAGGKIKDPNPAKIYASTEKIAKKVMDESLEMFAIGLSSLVNIFDPEKIILAGGLSNMNVYSRLNKLTKKYCKKEMRKHVKIVKNKLGDSAGVYGAGTLVFHG